MTGFQFSSCVKVCHGVVRDGDSYAYALKELQRLLGRMGIGLVMECQFCDQEGFCVTVTHPDASPVAKCDPLTPPLSGDAYRLQVSREGVWIDAPTGKGILNAVYDMAERLGVLFLLPEDAGEWLPPVMSDLTLPAGEWVMRPRFKYRGVFLQLFKGLDYSEEAWLRFYAKLRFNSVRASDEYIVLCRELGLRVEVGGHGLSSFLPRELYDEEPELFRMFQPADFGGKRLKDSNLCVTSLKARTILQEKFAEYLETVPEAHAVHAWADDLPAGGWCLCPSCRALPPTDQAMLAMRHLAQVAARAPGKPRVPVLAYHDTMRPGREIDAVPQCFLLYAPRERCYGHALDDPSCERNRFYLQALKEWINKFQGIDDAHTFEYYFDQILFRGLYPFLPGLILDDMKVYERNGIECHLSLQVGGAEVIPEFNMLVFAKGLWDTELTDQGMVDGLARAILPEAPDAWRDYLSRRAHIFRDAMRLCGHNLDIYMDYRWLPETTHSFGREMAKAYDRAATALESAAVALEHAARPHWPLRVRELALKESRRARFEAAEFRVMAQQQAAMNELGCYLNTGAAEALNHGTALLEAARSLLGVAYAKAEEAGLPKSCWYYRQINEWLGKEFNEKILNYKGR